jgi:penicillin-binding protein 1C
VRLTAFISSRRLRAVGRWARRGFLLALALSAAAATVVAIAVYAVPYPVEKLDPAEGGPLILTDRRGELLRTVPGADGRRQAWVPIERVPALAVLTFLTSEDENFFEHPGVDARGVARALYLNLKERRVGYGASTITMQLVRMLHSAGEERTLKNKIAEAILALRLERALDKRAILEQYLNRAPFGNGTQGIEAAARRYFDKPAAALSPGEATLLAVIPRAPTAYNPLVHIDAALERREHVFALLLERGLVTEAEVERARAQTIQIADHPAPFLAPHFTTWVLEQLPPEVKARGGVVRTTLDLSLQRRFEHRLREHVAGLKARDLDHAGAVILDTQSGEVLAMIGSRDFDVDTGQLNITTWKRHPGSALKPFVYALAIEGGDSPATVAYDIRDAPSTYRVHEGMTEHGPVRYREALAGSYNLAAVHTLEKVGVERLMTTLAGAGLGQLPARPNDYGLRLALGSARIRLIDLASAYGFLVKAGRVGQARGVIEASLADGTRWQAQREPERRIFSAQTSWIVMDMLADPEARRPGFGDELPFDLPFRVAAKTGTSRGFADTVAVGVTRQITVAAWAGNFDGKPTHGLRAMSSAAPLVRDGLLLAADGRALTLPPAPTGLEQVEVCALSGMRPGPHCSHRKLEYFRAGQTPRQRCTWHRSAPEGGAKTVYPPEIERWARRHREQGARHLTQR